MPNKTNGIKEWLYQQHYTRTENPVTTVGVALEAIKNFKGQNNPELTTEYLNIAQNELNRLNILTDKILKTAIFEDKGVTYTAEPVDLHQVINQVIDSMKLVFEKRKPLLLLTPKEAILICWAALPI